MQDREGANSIDRRSFLAATSAMSLIGLPVTAFAQQTPTLPGGKTLAAVLAEFIARFDLKNAPPEAIERARVAFIDTIGVMLAGSPEEVSHLVVEMVKLEGAAPAASIVGQSLRTSPQLAALANGVAGHAMDYDFTYLTGQSVAPVIPAVLALAEATGAAPSDCIAAFIVGVGGNL